MSTAEKAAAYFYTMADHLALAMLANWRNRLNGAFHTVERVPRPGGDQLEAFVIFVAANLASSHGLPPRVRITIATTDLT